jgi:hypothetical protein
MPAFKKRRFNESLSIVPVTVYHSIGPEYRGRASLRNGQVRIIDIYRSLDSNSGLGGVYGRGLSSP